MAETPETPANVAAECEDENSSIAANRTVNAELDDTQNSESGKTPDEAKDSGATAAAGGDKSADSAAPNKITITFRHVGNAPILKRNKFMLERTRNVHFIIEWLKKFMKLDLVKDQLFLYVNQEFSPSPDVDIGTLYDCFRVGNTVILHYCTTPAWG